MAYSTIDKSTSFQNNVLYTGNGTAIGSGGQAITGVGFSADFTWIKERSSTSGHHWFDTPRGATEKISSDSTAAESANAETLASWQSDGFTVGDAGGANQSGQTYVAWNWKAGTSSGVDFSSGDITPTAYSINTTSGIGIYHYNCTGANATMVHGLSSAPKMLITKSLGDTSPWAVWHAAMTATNYLVLNETAAQATNANAWNSTAPSSTVISFGSDGQTNGSGKNNIMYAFSDVKGYSKFGVYEGTGSASATPYIWTGFRPAYVMIKSYNNVHNWAIYDSKRLGRNADSNQGNASISANVTTIEQKDDDIDIFANGFRPRVTSNQVNGSGWLYS